MTKLLRLSFVMLFALVANIVSAQEAYKTLTFPATGGENVNGYEDTWTATIGTDSWTIVNFNSFKNEWDQIRCGRKKDPSVASIATDFAADKAINNVVVTYTQLNNADKINSISLVVASDKDFSNVTETVEANHDDFKAGDMTFKVTKPAANLYYKLVFDCDKAGSNGIIRISKVAYFEGEPGGGDDTSIANTPETAYTVSKAIELIAAGKGLQDNVYVKGVITKLDKLNTAYGDYNYYINDTKDATKDSLYIYNGKYLKNTDFTSEDQIKVGDEVIVYGKLKSYKGLDEMDRGNYIYSLNGKTEPDGGEPSDKYTPVASVEDLVDTYTDNKANLELTLTNAKVTYVNEYNDIKNVYIREGNAAIELRTLGFDIPVNSILSGKVKVDLAYYYGVPYLKANAATSADELTITPSEEAAEPVNATVADIQGLKYLNELVIVKDFTFTSEVSEKYTNYYANDGDARFMIYDKFSNIGGVADLTPGEKYTMVGVFGAIFKGTPEVIPVKPIKETTTGIDNIASDKADADAPVYNLAGQRVTKNFKGILIQNGRKFVNK